MYTNRPPPFAFGFNNQESVMVPESVPTNQFFFISFMTNQRPQLEPIYVKPVIIHAQGTY